MGPRHPGSFKRANSAFNHRAISPALGLGSLEYEVLDYGGSAPQVAFVICAEQVCVSSFVPSGVFQCQHHAGRPSPNISTTILTTKSPEI